MLSTLTSINRLRFHSMIRCCGPRHFHCRPSLFASARTYLMRTNSSFYLKPRGPVTVSSSLCLRSRLRLNTCITAFRPPGHRVPVIVQSTREFHTSGRLRALPAPLIWLVLKPLQKVMAIILGRSIRKWWMALPPNKKQLFREWTWRRRWHLLGAGSGLLIFISLLFLTHLDESPITGRTRLLLFSKEAFMELTQSTAEAYMEEFKDSLIAPSDYRHQAVELVVQTLAQRNKDIVEMSSVPWTVHVVDGTPINAFVLPNGEIFVFTGMLDAVADIHQLVFVLGHEMAHALIGHAAEQASLSHVVDLLSIILLTAIWAICPRDSLALLGQWIQSKLVQFLFERPYSRKLEAEADQVGLQLAAKACADVRAGTVFWQQMEINDQLTGQPTVPEWLSTHPSHQNRVRQLDRLVPEALELRARCDCPALPEVDPRVVFYKSVQLLLDKIEKQEMMEKKEKNEKERAGVMLPRPQTPPVLAQGSPPQLGGVLVTSALPQTLLSK
ncbi:metalloendopeptidase OMA1, mitochondrial-like isoform X2 [Ctenopharyngodon idella]|uniref:metalloendopeptidase OMA1, mitochondrial-like isoform X2 n=1 Tax=Ctenopharyngodon idella TaxID=7959 RepID=UPI00222E9BBB|nr:metalloendopeptidase OMA1, mitochondrial-like isoform X2 [Ctenopharyngodon idella]XP_051731807.1 metalloendopeptidase OMA1, mitochondrial-like isoform X2 [Ctenopharyngodon idella]